MRMSSANSSDRQADRLQQLESVEQSIASSLQYAGQGLAELSKDKPVTKQVEASTTQFMKTLEGIESNLIKHISYLTTVSTGQPHEGSCYAAYKDYQMAQHRQDHVKSRLAELDRLRLDRMHQQQQQRSAAESGFSVPSTSLSLSDL